MKNQRGYKLEKNIRESVYEKKTLKKKQNQKEVIYDYKKSSLIKKNTSILIQKFTNFSNLLYVRTLELFVYHFHKLGGCINNKN